LLRFELERHGGTVNGSTRAEVHHWVVNLAEMSAHVEKSGHRQLRPTQTRLNVKPLVAELDEAQSALRP
jgi:hypothetical protein